VSGDSRLAAAAEERGIGPVVSVHRRSVDLGSGGVKWLVIVAGAGCVWLATASRWLGLLLAVLAIAGALLVYRRIAVPFDAGEWSAPLQIAVCRHGLVLDTGYGEPRALSWGDIRRHGFVVRGPGWAVYEVAYSVPDGVTGVVEIRGYRHRAALISSIERQQPVVPPRWPVIAGVSAAALLAGLFVWRAVLPDYTVRTIDGAPRSVDGYRDVCRSPGTAFAGAPAFTGRAPRGAVAYFGSAGWEGGASPLDPAGADAVQLVLCEEEDEQARTFSSMDCRYTPSGGVGVSRPPLPWTMHRAQYALRLYEARTRRLVEEATVVGEDESCPEEVSVLVGPGAPDQDYDLASQLTPAQVDAFLARHVELR
jgi:hypothetical protein